MSLTVSATEYGQLRIFRLSDALHAALEQDTSLAPLEQALGVIIAKPEDVQIVAADSIRSVGLAPFLAMGYGVAANALDEVPELKGDSTENYVVIRSGAFGGAAVVLSESVDATLLATLQEEAASAPPLTKLQSESAKGTVAPAPVKPPKSDARIGGMVATYALLVLFGLVAVMIWVAS